MTKRGRIPWAWWLSSLLSLAVGPPLNAATFTVRTTQDKGKGSLRYALEQANARAGSHSIIFDFDGAGPFRIQPVSPLPDVVKPVFIDATRLAGFTGTPIVELDGSRAGRGAHGLVLRGGHSEVRGLAIHHFDGAGLYLAGGVSNVVAGCWLGADPSAAMSGGNQFGLLIGGDSTYNTIGGLAASDGNVLSGNRTAGLAMLGSDTTGNVIEGNRIGANGIGVLVEGSATNTIGGIQPGARNVVSANGNAGILILGPAPGNVIQGNFIGLDPTGSRPLGNSGSGIVISNAVEATIGGREAMARNVISGNQFFGLDLSGEFHVVQGNFIGTDAAGLVAVPNGSAPDGTGGLRVAGAYHTIGGPEMESGNLVSGNRGAGLLLVQAAYCAVQCNWIGPDRTGVRALPGQSDGVVLIDSLFNTIGGAGTVEGNLISGNENHGLVLRGESQRNVIQRNWIGLNLAGLAPLPNGGS
ncbi:MAG TPA: right-handed parallel beta-helix repeat-containing protein, partial [Methylomirabilota bacterium]|nr:right-handed parallel beta-helix repeat-containing protein [Methylomirabilota bacterium]